MRITFSPEVLDLSRRVENARTDNYRFCGEDLNLINETNEYMDRLWKVAHGAFRVANGNAVSLPQNVGTGTPVTITVGRATGQATRFGNLLSGSPCKLRGVSLLEDYGLWLPYEQDEVTIGDKTYEARYIYLRVDDNLAIDAFPKALPHKPDNSMLGTWKRDIL